MVWCGGSGIQECGVCSGWWLYGLVVIVGGMQACMLNLERTSSSLEAVTSVVFEPFSHSLALTHSDSSILLFPSLPSPFSPQSSSPPQTLIPPLSTSSCFLRLHSNPISPLNNVLFVVAGPYYGGSAILLRFWILHRKLQLFTKAQLKYDKRGGGGGGGGVVVSLSHGFSVKLYGSVNVFALHSVSVHKIWIFAVKAMSNEDDCVSVKLIKCAVIDSMLPICSITLSLGYLLLGENNGVWVFSLRPLVKGVLKKSKRENNQNAKEILKLRTVKLKHSISVDGAIFVAFKCSEIQNQKSMALPSLKAVSINSLSQRKFLVLDSVGCLHLLSLFSAAAGLETTCQMGRLNHTVKVQMLAVVPDISARTRTVWISDGLYSVHIMSMSDMDFSVNEDDKSEKEEEPMKISAMQAVFTSEKIRDLIPLSPSAILVLGQGNVFAYAIS